MELTHIIYDRNLIMRRLPFFLIVRLVNTGCNTLHNAVSEQPKIEHFDKNLISVVDSDLICECIQELTSDCDTLKSYYQNQSGINVLIIPHYTFKNHNIRADSLIVNQSVIVDRTLIFDDTELLATIFHQQHAVFMEPGRPLCKINGKAAARRDKRKEKQYNKTIFKVLNTKPEFIFTVIAFGRCWFYINEEAELNVMTHKGKSYSWETFKNRKDLREYNLRTSYDTPADWIK
jgi:hypothetical protein